MSDADPGRKLSSASIVEGLRFTVQAMLPNVVQGLFRRRRRAVAAATRLNVDGQAVGLIGGIVRSHGSGPVWVRAGTDQMLLAHSTEDVRRVLEGSPHPFASDPEAKRRGMSHFQPHALTISRGEDWANRRRFAEAVLDTSRPQHRLSERFAAVVSEEAHTLLLWVRAAAGDELDWDAFHRANRRLTRRIVLGDAARDDEELTDLLAKLMDEANGLPDESETSESFAPYMSRLEDYVDAAEQGSLVGLFGEAPADEQTKVPYQVTHWLFALGDTLAANAFRALAAIVVYPGVLEGVRAELVAAGAAPGATEGALDASAVARLPYLEACLNEAMRLWTTTPILSRETVEETDWNGAKVPAGTQILISNTFNHRDPERLDFADRFAPEEWIDDAARPAWSQLINSFSHGPQGCPGAGIALFAGKALLAHLLAERRISLTAPDLDPERPAPHMLDYFSIRFAVKPRAVQ